MLRISFGSTLLLLAACGSQSEEEMLQNAANQSDPAAAAILNGAAENGMDPQQALEQAGQAAAASNADATPPSGSLQAKPNLPQDPNRPEGGQPPEKVSTTNEAANEDHQGDHNAH